MKGTKPEKFKCTEPGCEAEYNDKAHLGINLRAKHGIAGRSANAIKNRELRHAAKAAEAQPTKRKYTKRSELATIPQETNGHVHPTSNGQAQTLSRPRFHSEAALAVAYGRFTAPSTKEDEHANRLQNRRAKERTTFVQLLVPRRSLEGTRTTRRRLPLENQSF
jgi:hypothetical protein